MKSKITFSIFFKCLRFNFGHSQFIQTKYGFSLFVMTLNSYFYDNNYKAIKYLESTIKNSISIISFRNKLTSVSISKNILGST